MRTLLFSILAFLVFWAVHPGETVFMMPHVSQEINNTSKAYYLETARCLKYFKFLGDVYIYNYETPRILKSTKHSVSTVPCTTNEIPFHNHPSRNLSNSKLQHYYKTATGDSLKNKNQMVYASYSDMLFTYYGGYNYIIVGANGEWAWWSRKQVARAGAFGTRLLRPISNQTTL